MKSMLKNTFLLISLLILGSSLTLAQPAKNNPGHQKQDKPAKAQRFVKNGPPPWAPAQGYRSHENYRDYGLVAIPIDIPSGQCNREVMGQVLGGAVGGVVGSQVGDGNGRLIAVAAGTLIGMVIGGEIGKSMDRADRLCLDQALEHAPDGSPIHWNSDSSQYTVIPRTTVQGTDGKYCREYTMESDVQGRPQQVYGTACRQPDGSWQITGN